MNDIMFKNKLKKLIMEVLLEENWTNWSLIIDRTGKIHSCGMDHASWMDSHWKPKSMAPGYKINVQSHGDDEQVLTSWIRMLIMLRTSIYRIR